MSNIYLRLNLLISEIYGAIEESSCLLPSKKYINLLISNKHIFKLNIPILWNISKLIILS